MKLFVQRAQRETTTSWRLASRSKDRMLRILCGVWCLAAVCNGLAVRASGKASKKKASKSGASGGFGSARPSTPKRQQLSGEKLLEKSEDRYAELEAKYDGEDDDEGADELFLRDFVIAVKAEKAPQFSDWVPVAVVGVVTQEAADICVPKAVALHKREIVEAARDVAGGRAAKLSFNDLEISTEPIHDWEKRVLDTVNTASDKRSAELSESADVLLLEDADAVDAVGLKSAYRARCKQAHPDSRGDDESIPTINECRVAFEALSAHIDRRATDARYESLGGHAKSFRILADLPADPNIKGDAAATRIDPGIPLPFLLRNVQRNARTAKGQTSPC